jgi:galactonate dehydratase
MRMRTLRGSPVTRRRWGIAVLLGASVLFNYFDRLALSVAGPQLRIDLHLDAFTLGVLFSAFNWSYAILLMGFAATLHVCAVIPNFLIAEYFVNFEDACGAIATRQIKVEDGFAELPTTPGLGVDIDVEKLQQRPYQDFKGAKTLTEDWEEFPRKNYAPGRLERV